MTKGRGRQTDSNTIKCFLMLNHCRKTPSKCTPRRDILIRREDKPPFLLPLVASRNVKPIIQCLRYDVYLTVYMTRCRGNRLPPFIGQLPLCVAAPNRVLVQKSGCSHHSLYVDQTPGRDRDLLTDFAVPLRQASWTSPHHGLVLWVQQLSYPPPNAHPS